MPRNGSGNFLLPINSWNPAINGVSATPADWQALINDVAAAIQASIASDGQTPMSGDLAMGGYRLTGAGAPSGAGQSLRWEQLIRGADIPSAATLTIPLEGQLFAITGTTAITAINATIAGRLVYFKMDAGIVLTHSSSLIMPAGVNVTTVTDDIVVFLSVSAGVWRCVSYPRYVSSDYAGAEPTITFPYMPWADTANMLLKRRNAANSTWVVEGPLLADYTKRPTFKAFIKTTGVLSRATALRYVFDSMAYNSSSDYSAASGLFTPEIRGIYLINACVTLGPQDPGATVNRAFIRLEKNGAENLNGMDISGVQADTLSLTSSWQINMNGTTDSVGILVYALTSAGNYIYSGDAAGHTTYFEGSLLRPD